MKYNGVHVFMCAGLEHRTCLDLRKTCAVCFYGSISVNVVRYGHGLCNGLYSGLSHGLYHGLCCSMSHGLSNDLYRSLRIGKQVAH